MACYNSADLLAVRFSLLDVDGSPLCSEVDGSAYDMKPVSLAITPTVETGETVTNRAGDGTICYTRTDPDVPTGADLVLTICTFDVELIALATGAESYVDPTAGRRQPSGSPRETRSNPTSGPVLLTVPPRSQRRTPTGITSTRM